jgi:RimJ/RimL family protein N-acetyltransferase
LYQHLCQSGGPILKISDERHRGFVTGQDGVAMAATALNRDLASRALALKKPQGDKTISLSDGTVVKYRSIRPTDERALRRFHDQLSGESVRLRFMGVLPHLSDRQAYYFTHLNERDRVAFVALDPCNPAEIIAVVRYDRDPGTDRAEYAAVVTDRWQGRGLGLALTHRLIEAARAQDIRSFYALVLPENMRMLNLLRDLGLPERITFEDQIERVEIDLVGTSSTSCEGEAARFARRPAPEAAHAA